MHKLFQQRRAAIHSARQLWEIEIYNIDEDARPAEVTIDFGLGPVGLSSIGLWCLPLEAGWILSLEPERLRILPTCETLSSKPCNIISTMYADALEVLECLELVCDVRIRCCAARKPV